MGDTTVKLARSTEERKKFIEYLLKDVKALETILESDLIEKGKQRIGAEQELCFIDSAWRPATIVMEVLDKIDDAHYTTELARYNMEINLDPIDFGADCFSILRKKLVDYLEKLEAVIEGTGNKVLLTGILPTIRSTDLTLENITPLERYYALDKIMKELRGGEFEFRITGTDELITRHNSVMFESCNTSYQVHFQVDPKDFVSSYNWAQAISGPVLAAATNSPLLLGKRLWAETRIALFQQSVDFRQTLDMQREISPRVSFGKRWIKESIIDIFKEDVVRHKILITKKIESDSVQLLKDGKIPKLEALCVHNGTIYKWNRACYGVNDGVPHLRIENRVLPSGPTVDDQIANTAFWVGLMNGVPKKYRNIHNILDFDDAKANFMKAARQGLHTQFSWVRNKKVTPRELILDELLPIASEGLQKAGIDSIDQDYYLDIIRNRVKTGKTGSLWMQDSFEKFKRKGAKEEALVAVTAATYKRQKIGKPVHTWKAASLEDAGSWINYYWRIDQIMSTDLFAVNEEDHAELVTKIMDWRSVRHVPVENNNGELVGLITSGLLVHNLIDKKASDLSIKDIMITDLVTVPPDTYTMDGLDLMREKKVGCLLIEKDKKLVGIVTEHDFVDIAAQLFKEVQSKK